VSTRGNGKQRPTAEDEDLGKIVDFCASIFDIGAPPMASEYVLEQAGVAIPVSAFVLLRWLDSSTPLSVSQLAAHVGLHPTTVSTQLRPLDEHGFIERHVDERDRRVAWIAITPAGRTAHAQVRAVVAGQWRIILVAWSTADRHQLAELLDRARRDTHEALHAALAEQADDPDARKLR
jgi:DNA-binding MarR family transcriptional regulator